MRQSGKGGRGIIINEGPSRSEQFSQRFLKSPSGTTTGVFSNPHDTDL